MRPWVACNATVLALSLSGSGLAETPLPVEAIAVSRGGQPGYLAARCFGVSLATTPGELAFNRMAGSGLQLIRVSAPLAWREERWMLDSSNGLAAQLRRAGETGAEPLLALVVSPEAVSEPSRFQALLDAIVTGHVWSTVSSMASDTSPVRLISLEPAEVTSLTVTGAGPSSAATGEAPPAETQGSPPRAKKPQQTAIKILLSERFWPAWTMLSEKVRSSHLQVGVLRQLQCERDALAAVSPSAPDATPLREKPGLLCFRFPASAPPRSEVQAEDSGCEVLVSPAAPLFEVFQRLAADKTSAAVCWLGAGNETEQLDSFCNFCELLVKESGFADSAVRTGAAGNVLWMRRVSKGQLQVALVNKGEDLARVDLRMELPAGVYTVRRVSWLPHQGLSVPGVTAEVFSGDQRSRVAVASGELATLSFDNPLVQAYDLTGRLYRAVASSSQAAGPFARRARSVLAEAREPLAKVLMSVPTRRSAVARAAHAALLQVAQVESLVKNLQSATSNGEDLVTFMLTDRAGNSLSEASAAALGVRLSVGVRPGLATPRGPHYPIRVNLENNGSQYLRYGRVAAAAESPGWKLSKREGDDAISFGPGGRARAIYELMSSATAAQCGEVRVEGSYYFRRSYATIVRYVTIRLKEGTTP